MKKLIIIFISVLIIISASGCQRIHLPWGKKASPETNDLFSENIREDFSSTNTNNTSINTNTDMTEPVKPGLMSAPATNAAPATNMLPGLHEKSQPLAVEPEVGQKSNAGGKVQEPENYSSAPRVAVKGPAETSSKKMKSKTRAVRKEKTAMEQTAREQTVENEQGKSGIIIIIGNGATNQSAAPRKSIKMTFVAFSKLKDCKYCDFIVYAMPVGRGKTLDSSYMIGAAENIDLINGQAQYTKFWNGRNVDEDFLVQDNYNVYVYYKLKNAKYEVLKKEGRYWGIADKNYIGLK